MAGSARFSWDFIPMSLLLVLTLPARASSSSFFTGVGFLPGDSTVSLAYGISGNGQVVVGESRVFGRWEAFRWTAAAGIEGLGPGPFSQSSIAFSASYDGSVISGIHGGAAMWTPDAGWQSLAGPADSYARGVSHDGTLLAGQIKNQAVRFNVGNAPQFIGTLAPDQNSFGLGISGDGGAVVGYGITSGGERAFKWTNASGMVMLPSIGGNANNAAAINISADASTIVGWSSGSLEQQAVLWHDQGVNPLGTLVEGDTRSLALDISGDGDLVVGWSGTPLVHTAFLWDATRGMRNLRSVLINQYGLNLANWTLEEATGISDDGMTMTGLGINPSGQRESWVAHIPNPGTICVFIVAASSSRRRSRT
jgi:probable HAF family extracellular repeat protein